MNIAHKHAPFNQLALPYVAPIYNAVKNNLRAHDGITRIEVCQCGAVRLANVNDREAEFSRWVCLPKEQRS